MDLLSTIVQEGFSPVVATMILGVLFTFLYWLDQRFIWTTGRSLTSLFSFINIKHMLRGWFSNDINVSELVTSRDLSVVDTIYSLPGKCSKMSSYSVIAVKWKHFNACMIMRQLLFDYLIFAAIIVLIILFLLRNNGCY